MRFLALSCIHEKTHLVEKLVEELEGESLDFDVMAGDVGRERHFKQVFELLGKLNC